MARRQIIEVAPTTGHIPLSDSEGITHYRLVAARQKREGAQRHTMTLLEKKRRDRLFEASRERDRKRQEAWRKAKVERFVQRRREQRDLYLMLRQRERASQASWDIWEDYEDQWLMSGGAYSTLCLRRGSAACSGELNGWKRGGRNRHQWQRHIPQPRRR